MKKILYIELFLVSIQICEQYANYYPNYMMNQHIVPDRNVHYNNYGAGQNRRRAGYRKTHPGRITLLYGSDSDYSEFTDSSEECSPCSCNQCYKSKRCCKSVCNSCNSLVIVPYPVPFLIPEMSSEGEATQQETTTETTTSTTESTTTTKTATVTETSTTTATTPSTSTVTTTESTSGTTITKSVEETSVSEQDPDLHETEFIVPYESKQVATLQINKDGAEETASTMPFFVASKKKLKKITCPPILEGACFSKAKRQTVASRSFYEYKDTFFERPLQKLAAAISKNGRRVHYIRSTTPYYVPLRNVIPIPDALVEKLLSQLHKVKIHRNK